MTVALAILIEIVSLPFHAWCHLRHRKLWQIVTSSWLDGWECPVDGFLHSLSPDDVSKLMAD